MERIVVLPERERGVCCPPTIRLRPEKVAGTSEILKALADPTRLQMAIALRDKAAGGPGEAGREGRIGEDPLERVGKPAGPLGRSRQTRQTGMTI